MEQQQQLSEFEVGDAVAWNYGAGKARGHVVEKLTQDRKLGARTFKASPEEPKYLLKIDKTGKEAIRKGETLERIEESEEKHMDALTKESDEGKEDKQQHDEGAEDGVDNGHKE